MKIRWASAMVLGIGIGKREVSTESRGPIGPIGSLKAWKTTWRVDKDEGECSRRGLVLIRNY